MVTGSYAKPIVTERHVPTALTDRQQQDLIYTAVAAERERILGILKDELLGMDGRGGWGTGWSWDKWRAKMLKAIDAI